jgi:hypothetical protein
LRLSKPVCSAIAAMTPLWKGSPFAPPALKTMPTETMGEGYRYASADRSLGGQIATAYR